MGCVQNPRAWFDLRSSKPTCARCAPRRQTRQLAASASRKHTGLARSSPTARQPTRDKVKEATVEPFWIGSPWQRFGSPLKRPSASPRLVYSERFGAFAILLARRPRANQPLLASQ